MLRAKNLKSNVLIWLLVLAIGLSALGCNNSNHLARRLVPGKGRKVSVQSERTAAVVPTATSNKSAKHDRVNKASFSDINGLGKTLEGAVKFTRDVAVVAGTVIGILFVDYQLWRLADKMF